MRPGGASVAFVAIVAALMVLSSSQPLSAQHDNPTPRSTLLPVGQAPRASSSTGLPPKSASVDPSSQVVYFVEVGLSFDTNWTITTEGYPINSSSSFYNDTVIPLELPAGSYQFLIQNVSGYPEPSPDSVYFTVANSPGTPPSPIVEQVSFADPSFFYVNVTVDNSWTPDGWSIALEADPIGGLAPYNFTWGLTNLVNPTGDTDCSPAYYGQSLGGYGDEFEASCAGPEYLQWFLYAESALDLEPGYPGCFAPPECSVAESWGAVYAGTVSDTGVAVDLSDSSPAILNVTVRVNLTSEPNSTLYPCYLNFSSGWPVSPFGSSTPVSHDVENALAAQAPVGVGFGSFSFVADKAVDYGLFDTGAYGQFYSTNTPTYEVSFEQAIRSQLPETSEWAVDFSGDWQLVDNGDDLAEYEDVANGTYEFEFYPLPGFGAFASGSGVYPSSVGYGNVTVEGADVTVEVTFLAYTYGAVFQERGLPQNLVGDFNESIESWLVTLTNETTGFVSPFSWNLTAMLFPVANGSYSFVIGNIPGWTPSLTSGVFTIEGGSTWINLTFSPAIPALNVLYGVYNERSDLQSAYPGVTEGVLSSIKELVNWASDVVNGEFADEDYSALAAPDVAYFYELMGIYNARSDLESAFPNAYADLGSYQALLGWAGQVVDGQYSDSSNSSLRPWSYAYALLDLYGDRPDLQSAYPGATLSLMELDRLFVWAGGVVNGSYSDSASSTLSSFGYFYELMWIYGDRSDLQTAFPFAEASATSFRALVDWSGEVVNGSFADSSKSNLDKFGYWYVLLWTYDGRSDLQAAFPYAYSQGDSLASLFTWARGVVERSFSDSAYVTLLPYASEYESAD